MNDKTLELLEKMAAKLGTTAEMLWGALLKQAQISSISTSAMLIIMLSILIFCFLKIKKVDDEEWRAILYIFWALTLVISFAITCTAIGGIMSGFFNPEYWALMEIIKNAR